MQYQVALTHCSDAIWQHRSGSALAQVTACCLTATSHYLNQCWLIISEFQWHSSEGDFIRDTSAINHQNYLENYWYKILSKSPRGQCVKPCCNRPHCIAPHESHPPLSSMIIDESMTKLVANQIFTLENTVRTKTGYWFSDNHVFFATWPQRCSV